MQQPLALLTNNSTIFWEHEVFVDCCHSNRAISIFSIYFSKKCEKMEKILVLMLVLLTNFFILSSV